VTDHQHPIVYDKAEYHFDSVRDAGLSLDQAYVHTAFYLGWLIDNGLTGEEFRSDWQEEIAAFKAREISAVAVYQACDGCFVDDMLNDEGNGFTQAYFDFSRGPYMDDYRQMLGNDLATEFGVPWSWSNYECIANRITQRFNAWRHGE
jgi:hypothetical protein